MQEPLISVSGLRGVIGESLTPPLAIHYAAAFAAELPPGPILIARDGRPSGLLLADAIRAGLMACGRDVLDAGVAATPTVGVLVRQRQAAGGIQISASHNPPQYNGLKLFSSAGRVVPADEGQRVVDRYRRGKLAWAAHDELGRVHVCSDTLSQHCRLVLEQVDVEPIRRRRFRVFLDSNHGAGGLLGRRLLEELGCDVVVRGEEPDGQFEHPPEPLAENLSGIGEQVAATGADIGFCQDPDADRLAILDEQGRYLGEEYTLALCVAAVLERQRGPIVTNCSTSRMSEDVARRHDVPFFRSKVGEAHVVDLMLREKAVLGGEGNGGVIDPRVGLVRDSFVGMALVLDWAARRGLPISRLAAELPRYAIFKTKIAVEPHRADERLAALETRFAEARADRLDGLRLDWPDKWLLVRASNTEPVVRAIAEAPTEVEARQLCEEAARVLVAS